MDIWLFFSGHTSWGGNIYNLISTKKHTIEELQIMNRLSLT